MWNHSIIKLKKKIFLGSPILLSSPPLWLKYPYEGFCKLRYEITQFYILRYETMLNTSMSGKPALLETHARKKTQFRILEYEIGTFW
jgi:hypothetical protein